MPIWNVRDAFIESREKYFVPRSVDNTLNPTERALCGEAANGATRAINALDVNDLWPVGQRVARYADCRDKVLSLSIVDGNHFFGDSHVLYDGMDLLDDAAFHARLGLTSFYTSVEPLP